MMNFDASESPEFRLHIRRLLYDYSLTHLTTNYLSFTENLVSEFIEYLQPIPLTDPYSLVLSVDPFLTFSQQHSFSSLKPYDETPQTTKEALAYLKTAMRTYPGQPLTEKIALYDRYATSQPIEPFIPILTRRARRNTPKIGKKTKKPYTPREYAELLKTQKIDVITVEPVKEPILSPEDILKVKCQIQPEELPAVRALLQTTTAMMRPQKSYKNKYLDPEYLRNIPSQKSTFSDDPFIPIFPRARRPRSGAVGSADHLPDLQGFGDIPKAGLQKAVVEDLDVDMSRQNLVIVDGWETIKSSPPSPPLSINSDDKDEIDELFLTSTPDTDPAMFDEKNLKMEPILLPRSRKIGGSSGVSPHILAGKTIATFLQPLLKVHSVPEQVHVPEKTEDDIERPHASPTPSSLLGQPPSELGSIVPDKVVVKPGLQDLDLDSELKNLYVGHNLEDMILKEALDDKQELMMDVPILPAPNIHPPHELRALSAFSDLLIQPTTAKDVPIPNKATRPLHRFLKKTKGRESLTLALSWVPFTVDKKLPSAAELLGVVEVFSEVELATSVNQTKMEALLKSLDLSDDCDIHKRWRDFDTLNHKPPAAPVDFEILRTREERWRLARLENRLEDGMDSEDVEERQEDTVEDLPDEVQDHEKVKSRVDLPSDDVHIEERPLKRPRLDAEAPIEQQDVEFYPMLDMYVQEEQYWRQPVSPQLSASDDKENCPPLSFSSSLPDEMRQDEDPVDCYIEHLDRDADPWAPSQPRYRDSGKDRMEEEDTFEPLSFGSRQPAFDGFDSQGYGSLPEFVQAAVNAHGYGMEYLQPPQDNFDDVIEFSPEDRLTTNDNHESLSLTVEPKIASHSLGIAAFAQLRARRIKETNPLPVSEPISTPAAVVPVDAPDELQTTPQDLFDRQTLRLPDDLSMATSIHRYLSSVDLIQKHALVRSLRSDECAVELVERQSLDGVDLILDPHCAVVFLSIFMLPGRCEAFVAQVSQQSWNYSRILVVFEAYPEQRGKRAVRKDSHKAPVSELYAYTPPILKAVKKFRRDVNIAEGCGTKCPSTKVEYAFANTVEESAHFTRMYGDMAEARDETQGIIWGEREWLAADFSEDEEGRLAGLNGLNRFSSSIILCQVSLQDFVDMSPEERVDGFAGFIGVESMVICNADLEARLEGVCMSFEMEEPYQMEGNHETY